VSATWITVEEDDPVTGVKETSWVFKLPGINETEVPVVISVQEYEAAPSTVSSSIASISLQTIIG